MPQEDHRCYKRSRIRPSWLRRWARNGALKLRDHSKENSRKKDAIEAAIKAGIHENARSWAGSTWSSMMRCSYGWSKQRGQNLPVGGDLIKEKVLKLAELMQIPDFIASDGWLDDFKKHATLPRSQWVAYYRDLTEEWNVRKRDNVTLLTVAYSSSLS